MMKDLPRRLILLAGLLAAPSLAAESPAAPPAAPPETAAPAAPEPNLVDTIKALSQFLNDEEVQLVYDYLWDSSIATLKGEPDEATLPPEVAFKLAILQARIMKEGGAYLEGLARRMEQDLADYWRNRVLTPPPPVPYELPSERGKVK
jgi:hypothetical protein